MELNKYYGMAFAIFIAVIFLAIGAIVMNKSNENMRETGLISHAEENVTTAMSGNTTIITHSNLKALSINYATNATNGDLYALASNYTTYVEGGLGKVDWWDAEGATNVNLSYTYTTYGAPYNVTLNAQAGIDEVSSWADTWGTMIGAAAVILIISTAFFAVKRYW